MHPFVLDPDSVRIGDWRALGAAPAAYESPLRFAGKKSKAAFFAVLLLAGAVLWVETHQGVSKEMAATPPALAGEARNAAQQPPLQHFGPADAGTRPEFVDDWTFVYPAPWSR
jgi:hypothetical protein